MSAAGTAKPPPYIKPAMLRYKREWKGMSVDEAAKRMRIKPERISLWEAGKASPTVKQGLKLADVYECYFTELTFDKPLPAPKPKIVPDFRLGPGKRADPCNPAVRDLLLWAESRHKVALSLYEDLDESPAAVPAKERATLGDDPESKARSVRQQMDYPLIAQVSSKGQDVPADLRGRMERWGILTFRSAARLEPAQARGLCYAYRKLPVVMFRPEAPAAQAFTLAHELGHVLLGQSGIIAPYAGKRDAKAERWCDRFAAAFLMPHDAISQLLGTPPHTAPAVFADEELTRLARHFRVSEHAMLIRLVHLKYVMPSYYWSEKRHEFTAREEKFRGFGRAKYYGRRYVSTMGMLFTTLVVRAWAEDFITVDKAAEFMDIKNFMHVVDIREEILHS